MKLPDIMPASARSPSASRSPVLSLLVQVLALAAVYFCLGKLGLKLAFLNASASPVWPPTGIALAAVLLWGYRVWPGIWLGAFLVNVTTAGTLFTSIGIATGNTLEALIGAWLVQRFANGRQAFEQARDIFKYVLLAAILSTMVSATFGVTSLALGGLVRWDGYFPVWLTWWLGDAVSALIVTPLIVIWSTTPYPRWPRPQIAEALLMLALVVLVGLLMFGDWLPSQFQWPFLCFPPLLWAAFRFGQRGAVSAAFALSGIALWGTLHEFGPFLLGDPNDSLLFLQVFVGTITVTNLVLGAVVSERYGADKALRKSEEKKRAHLVGNLGVTRILAESPALSDAMPRVLQTIGETLGWEVGAAWTPDPGGKVLRCLKIWHDPSVKIDQFMSVSYERSFAPGIGLPGRVWTSLKPSWIPDVTKDANFPRAPFAAAEGLHAAFAFPILSGEKFLGVMEFFSHEIRQPDDALLAMLGSIGSQIGQFMERKRAEEALRQLAAIVESSDDAIIGQDPNGIIHSWNAAAEKMYGYKAEEIIGQSISILIPPDRCDEEQQILARIRRGAGIDHYETVRLTKNGRRIDVSLTVSPIRDRDGNVIGASKIARDITERKGTEAALRESENRFRTLAETASDAIITIDEQSTIVFVNPATETVFGYSQQEMLGAKLTMLMPESLRDPHRAGLQRYKETGRRHISWQALELPGRHKSGREIPLEISYGEFTKNGKRFFTGIIRDITERKLAQQRLQKLNEELEQRVAARTAELQAINQELEAFSYSVSHDLRAPIRALHGFSRILLDQHGAQLPEEGQNHLRMVRDNALKMGRLVDDLLAFSRLGRKPVVKRDVNLAELAREVLAELNAEKDGRRVRITIGELPACQADPSLLRQVFLNLLSNALKFTRPREEANIEAGSMKESSDPDNKVVYFVRDNGVGFDMRYADKLFGVFQRLHSEEEYEGTGVGLALVQRIIHRHGGRIWAESAVNQGTTLYFTL